MADTKNIMAQIVALIEPTLVALGASDSNLKQDAEIYLRMLKECQLQAQTGDADLKVKQMPLIEDPFIKKFLTGEDYARAQKLKVAYCEALAEEGCVLAMRHTASHYANGHHSFVPQKLETGWVYSVSPDFQKALEWARKAAAAGDAVGQKIARDLEDGLNLKLASLLDQVLALLKERKPELHAEAYVAVMKDPKNSRTQRSIYLAVIGQDWLGDIAEAKDLLLQCHETLGALGGRLSMKWAAAFHAKDAAANEAAGKSPEAAERFAKAFNWASRAEKAGEPAEQAHAQEYKARMEKNAAQARNKL